MKNDFPGRFTATLRRRSVLLVLASVVLFSLVEVTVYLSRSFRGPWDPAPEERLGMLRQCGFRPDLLSGGSAESTIASAILAVDWRSGGLPGLGPPLAQFCDYGSGHVLSIRASFSPVASFALASAGSSSRQGVEMAFDVSTFSPTKYRAAKKVVSIGLPPASPEDLRWRQDPRQTRADVYVRDPGVEGSILQIGIQYTAPTTATIPSAEDLRETVQRLLDSIDKCLVKETGT